MKRLASLKLKWRNVWPWLAIAAAAYFLAKQIVQ
jgi:hypothetical protein